MPESEIDEPIAVSFPLSGEWCAANTPGHKVPSHGTNQLGQRYAYDFFQIDWEQRGYKYYKSSLLKSLICGVKLHDTYCWSKPIFSPFNGEVIEARDGLEERNPVHIFRDLAIAIKNAFLFRGESNADLHSILGNYIILKKEDGIFSLIAHARKGSIKVSKGEKIKEGQELAQVGHSGNSTAPHLHFQLMNSPNLLKAEGLPCCFKSYQVYKQDKWESVLNGIPGKRERINA
ncbi:M23 family metallopeptidase [Kaarinaea lacus]